MTAVDLFTPLKLGPYTLPSRIFMAPMTRNRAGAGNVPGPLNAEYYRQRASSGLLITEATQVCQQGQGYPMTPGIHSPEQIKGWKLVTDTVHKAGGRIYAQLWHVGRVSHNAYQPGNAAPVSSSAVALAGKATLPDFSSQPYPTPRALETDEIAGVIAQFRHGADCALKAGFDGVELHGANGYLPDQFLRDGVNQRKDRYGGSIANRARFLIEVTEALVSVWGSDRVGVKLSPSNRFQSMKDSTPRETFSHAVKELGRLPLAYVHVMEPKSKDDPEGIPARWFRPFVAGRFMINGGYDKQTAAQVLASGDADIVSFGQLYVSNPDLVERFRNDTPLTEPQRATFYSGEERGFTDYLPAGDVE